MRVRKIHFNHDPTSATCDAINLSSDDSEAPFDAEWSNGFARKAVVYARSVIQPPVTIKVVFGDGPPNGSVEIRAVAGVATDRPHDPLPVGDEVLPGCETPLGSLHPAWVQFDEYGNSQPILFEVKGRPDKAAVGKWIHLWTWEADLGGSTWRKFATTLHLIYLISALPNPPWTQDPNDPNGWSLPWDDAIDKACTWAAGAWTPEECVEAIAREINQYPLQGYTTVGSLVDLVPAQFNLTLYLKQLNDGVLFNVNCRDVATAVMTFANLLGANLWPLGMGTGFITHLVRPLVDPAPGAQTWGFHEVAVTQQSLPAGFLANVELPAGPDELVRIYDSCLRLPGDVLPLDMPFGSVPNSTGYRFALIAGPDPRDPKSDGNGTPARPRPRRRVI